MGDFGGPQGQRRPASNTPRPDQCDLGPTSACDRKRGLHACQRGSQLPRSYERGGSIAVNMYPAFLPLESESGAGYKKDDYRYVVEAIMENSHMADPKNGIQSEGHFLTTVHLAPDDPELQRAW